MLDKTFDPKRVESHLYQIWEEEAAFCPSQDTRKKSFTITMPPPNVTGTLHMGHALNMSLQDILARYKRMAGYNVLWQPGMDHAGIATQLIVERQLQNEGTNSKKIGRKAFIDRVWQWKEKYGGSIAHQLRSLGASPAWQRQRFTLDKSSSEAVKTAFITLYNDGLIYRDRRLVNWDPQFCSAISDLEVENKQTQGTLWYINYPLEHDNGHITIATTRPETMLADTAIAVHPTDVRYKQLIGKKVIVPIVGRLIPIIADTHSDPQKGTGAVKITPAHDFNDFEVGKRHDLAMISMLDIHGHIDINEIASDLQKDNSLCDENFIKNLAGKSCKEARKEICHLLEEKDFLEKSEPHLHNVPHGQRGDAVIEPRLTTQWFCDAPALAKEATHAVTSGASRFIPKQWENTFFAWMRDLQPWCISRQLWWGHQIPAWYGPDDHVFVAHDEDEALKHALAHYGKKVELRREEDVLDTWFSSGLWPFSTLGWPKKTKDLEQFYPTDVLVTGFDIIFFWVARMLMMSMYFMKKAPFKDIFVHGLVRDEHGQKMSKSKGNGIDPLKLIDQYGADALRFTICALTGVGRDLRFGEKRVKDGRSFITKIWNAARFLQMQDISAHDISAENNINEILKTDKIQPLTAWILFELEATISKATEALNKYRFDEYAHHIYQFVWHIFCDWYLELIKPHLHDDTRQVIQETKTVTAYVFNVILCLLQPVIPFVTDTLWHEMHYGKEASLIGQSWPQAVFDLNPENEKIIQTQRVIKLISEIRTIKAEMNIPPAQKTPLFFKNIQDNDFKNIKKWEKSISKMARISHIDMCTGPIPKDAVQIVLDKDILALLPLASFIDIETEEKRRVKETQKLEKERLKTQKRLDNPKFVENAKPEIVEEMRQRLQEQERLLKRFQTALTFIRSLHDSST